MSDNSRTPATIGGVPARSAETGAERQSLKTRLVEYWDSQEGERDSALDEKAVNLPIRGKMASFIPTGARILDVACGASTNADWFGARGKYFGTDISRTFLRLGIKPESLLTCADAEALPFADQSFNVVSFTFALEHTVNPVAVLQELGRVTGKNGRLILAGPSWDLPFWYPKSLQSRTKQRGWHLRYTISRMRGQLAGWLLGRLPFFTIDEPDAFSRPFEADIDAVYVVWSYEVIRQMERWGFRLIHSEVDDRLLGTRLMVKTLKRLLYCLPPYQLAGSTVLLVFEKN